MSELYNHQLLILFRSLATPLDEKMEPVAQPMQVVQIANAVTNIFPHLILPSVELSQLVVWIVKDKGKFKE